MVINFESRCSRSLYNCQKLNVIMGGYSMRMFMKNVLDAAVLLAVIGVNAVDCAEVATAVVGCWGENSNKKRNNNNNVKDCVFNVFRK